MIFGKADARAKYTVWAKIKALSPPDRRRLVNDNGESNWLSLLTPTQYAQLFPDYYKKALPDIGKSPTSGAGGTWSGDTISGGQSKYSTYEGRDSRYTKSYGREGTAERTEDIKQSKPYDPVTALNQRLEKETGIRVPSETTSGYLAEKRAKYFDELDNNPKLKDEVMRAIRAENGKNATSMSEVLESMVNRSDAFGYGSLDHALHNGFYGPINRGDTAYTRPLTKEERDMGEEAIARVRGGQNNIEFRTDQGMLTDPGSRKYLAEPDQGGWIKKSGENYFYMGKKGRAWAEAQRKAEAEWQAKQKQEFDSASRNVNPQMEDSGANGISPSTPEVGLRKGDEYKIPPADLNEAAKKYFDGLSDKQKETFFKQYSKAGAQKMNEWADEAYKNASGTPQGDPSEVLSDGNRVHQNQGRAKSRPGSISKNLERQLNYAATQTDVQVEVFSGGQRVPGEPKSWRAPTNTHNHDAGNAADFKIYRFNEKGEKEYIPHDTPEGRKIWSEFIKNGAKAGATSFGVGGENGGTYMSNDSIHMGGGSERNWGSSYHKDTAQPWAVRAHGEGASMRKDFNLDEWEKKRAKEEMDKASRNVNPDMTAEPVRPGISPSTPEPGLRHDFKGTEGGMGTGKDQITPPNVESSPSVNDKIQVEPNAVPKKDNMQMTPPDQKPGENNKIPEPPNVKMPDIEIYQDPSNPGPKAPSAAPPPSAAPAAPEPKATPVNPEPKPEAPKPESKGDNTPPPNKQSNLSTNNMPKVAAEMSNHSRVVPPSQERAMKQATLNNKDHFGHGSVNETA